MRVKDPSRVVSDRSKRHKKSNHPQDEDSSDDIAGLTCQHVSQAVDVRNVKRAVTQNLWSVCTECLKERRICDGEPVMPSDIWLCLKCGIQGCSQNSEGQHSLKHFQTAQVEPHCIVINLSTWIVWCYECNEELSTHCNKKALAQIVDFLQRHVARNESSSSSKVIWLHEENNEANDILKGKGVNSSWASVPVKGINNLGNTCFFNAVMQNLAQTHMLNELMCEMKERGTKLKIGQSPASQLDPLVVNLSTPGSLTSAMFLFLHSMKEIGKGPLSPKVLFNQLCQKAPRFKGYQQQDSQEVLHYLLDAMRIEETKRIQSAILKAFNNPTTKTADEETKRKVKAYGREGVKMNFIDRIFVGELTSTIMCEECENISTVKEPFIDLSLPIIEERISKPVSYGRTSKNKADIDQYSCSINSLNNQQSKLSRKQSLTKDKKTSVCKRGHSNMFQQHVRILHPQPSRTKSQNQVNHEKRLTKKSSSGEEEAIPFIMQEETGHSKTEGRAKGSYTRDSNTAMDSGANGSPIEGSEKEASHSEGSMDADSEASESETASSRACCTPGLCTIEHKHVPGNITLQHNNSDCSNTDTLTDALSKLRFSNRANESVGPFHKDPLSNLSNNFSAENPLLAQGPQNAFQTLSQSYTTSSKECSVQSCLYQFTSVELLMGNNKLLCENCTDRKQKYQKKSNTNGWQELELTDGSSPRLVDSNCQPSEKKTEGVYTNARKQLLISSVPAVLVLHLKRFHQAGVSLRKVNRHVDFPLVLDLAPFCSAFCKNVTDGGKVLYTLYGIVEHSGSMRGGHYAAFVKVRAPSKKLLEHISSNKNVQGLKESGGASIGQWVFVSDTHVQAVPESRVLNSQAYLLFYERML